MSARGARSRKVQQKDIEKKEKKNGKNKVVETIHEPHDGFANWRTTPSSNGTRPGLSRSMTMSSGTSRTTSQSSGTNDGRNQLRSNAPQTYDSLDISATSRSQRGASSATSTSDASTKAKEKTKFHAKGKDTSAPRGRGGGVPVKKPIAGPSINVRSESAASYPPDRKTWQDFKVWDGNKQGVLPYGGFEFDEDMQNGSVLIYFKEEQLDEEHPVASIRAELQVLRDSGSSWLNSVLEYGCLDEDDNDWALPSNSESFMPSYARTGSESQPARRMLGPTSLAGRSPPPFDIDQPYDGMSSRATSSLDRLSRIEPAFYSNSPIPQPRSSDSNPTHEIWFTAPDHITNPQEERLYHVAVRNFLALLHGKPIVGADLFDMLNTLQQEIETRYDMDNRGALSVTPRERSVQMITNYLGQHGIDDVRTSIKSAMCILAWAEQDNVRWRQGYLETFVHLAGVMIPELEEVREFKRLSVVTRRNLGLAAKALKLRVMEAEEKLSSFDLDDMWEDSTKLSNSAAYNSYRAFRQFLVEHYARHYGNWPLATNKTWLNRKIILALQEDFGSLYDYLVNRDVVWNPREERASRKWEMAHRKNHEFKADVPELGVTDVLVRYDARNGYAHIPHPYPLLPQDLPKVPKEKEKKSLFSSLKKDKSKDVAKDAKAHLQLSILFSDATNIEKLDVNFNGSTLIDKFEQFELTTDLKNSTPREARLGRWVLLYGILQVLSTLSVDVQGLKHKDGVRYFLCTDLKRCPEWVTNGQVEYLEANQQRSWCWQRSWDPSPTQTAPVELEAISSRELFTELEHDSGHYGYAIGETHQPREISPPTSPSDTVALQNDIRRIGEKIDNFSIPHHQPAIEYERRRRENEKAIAADFHNFKPRLDSLPLHQPHPPHPTPANPAHVPHHRRQHAQETFYLTDQDEQALTGPPPPPPPRSHMRQTIDSVNTDLGGYPFSPAEIQWPVPQGYGGTANHRESGIGYNTGSWEGYGDGQGVRDGYREVRPRDAEARSPRRIHERNGWA